MAKVKKTARKMDFGKQLVASLQELRNATVASTTGRLTVRVAP